MILKAAEMYSIDLEKTAMIGDRSTDMEAASLAQVRGVLLQRFSREASPVISSQDSAGSRATLLEAVTELYQGI